MSIHLLLTCNHTKNIHFVHKYIKFIESRPGLRIKGDTHHHHILPKAKDMFPQFQNLKTFPWNGIHLTAREHFIAHWMLSKAFPKSSQVRAFYHITNVLSTKKSQEYAVARKRHIEAVIAMTQNPERCQKISRALSGKPKSKDHVASMIEHPVSEKTRDKLRNANLGKKHSEQSKLKMSVQRKGKSKAKNTLNSNLNIAKSLCKHYVGTPIGVFQSHLEASIAYKVSPRRIVLIFQNLDKIPRKKVRQELGIDVCGKTYRELGFEKIAKIA